MPPQQVLIASVTSVCNPHNELFAQALNFVRAMPLSLWIAFSGLTYITGEWYFYWLSHTYLFTYFVVHPVLGALVLASGPAHPHCDSRDYVGPALEVVLLYQYLAQALLHALVWRLRIRWQSALWRLVLAVFIPWVLHYSGNYSTRQVVEGALVGLALGAAYMYFVLCMLRPRFLQLNHSWLSRWMGMYTAHDICHVFYHYPATDEPPHHSNPPNDRHFIMTQLGDGHQQQQKQDTGIHSSYGITRSRFARHFLMY